MTLRRIFMDTVFIEALLNRRDRCRVAAVFLSQLIACQSSSLAHNAAPNQDAGPYRSRYPDDGT